MNKGFDLDSRCPGELLNLLQSQGPLQHHARKPDIGQETHLFRGGGTHLRRGMQIDRRQIHPQKGHILHNQGISSDLPHPGSHPLRFGQLLFVQQRIHRNEHARPEPMSQLTQASDLFDRHSGRCPRSKPGSPHIQRISPTQQCRPPRFEIFRRGQQFKFAGTGAGHFRTIQNVI